MPSGLPKTHNVQGAQALERAIKLIRLIAAHGRAGVRQVDLIQASKLTPPTVHRLMRTLERNGYIEREDETGRYFLGPEIHALGITASTRFDLLRAGSPAVARLTRSTADSVVLSGRVFWHAICLARDEGEYPIRSQIMYVGQRVPLGTTAAGIAIIATLDDDEVVAALETNKDEIAAQWPRFTKTVVIDLVAQTRARGYALNPGLVIPGSWGLAVSIRGPDGSCIGALTVSAIEQRLNAERQAVIAATLRKEVAEVERRLLHPSGGRQGSPAK